MKSGVTKATGQNIGKGIVNLPKVLKIPGVAAKPAKPTFGTKAGIIEASEVTTTISAAFDCDIYYSVDGKTPAFKNGVITNGIKAVANPETITVNGIVAGKATGKVTVKAIAVNKYTMTAGPVATVKYTLKPAVEKVTITGDTVQVVAGKSVKLKADVAPAYAANKKVEWKINANASAGVKINANNGKVTTTKTATPGTYQVTAKAKDGKGAADTYTITVMADAKVKSVAFKEAKVTLKVKTDTVAYKMADNLTALKVDDTPATAEDFVWTSSKQAVARVNRTTGEVTAVGAGSAVITAMAADGSGVKKTCTVVVEQLATAIAITQPVNTEDVEIVTLAAGKSAALKATVTPTTTKQKKLTWSIDAPASSGVTANPSNGKVTAAANATKRSKRIKVA